MPDKNTTQSDHDILITLVATVDNNHKSMVEKMTDLKTDVVEIKDGSNREIAELKGRVVALEKITADVNLVKLAQLAKEDHDWLHDFRINWKYVVGTVSFVSGVFGAGIVLLLNFFKLIQL